VTDPSSRLLEPRLDEVALDDLERYLADLIARYPDRATAHASEVLADLRYCRDVWRASQRKNASLTPRCWGPWQ
jgi:uncharacterized membrane protein YccC